MKMEKIISEKARLDKEIQERKEEIECLKRAFYNKVVKEGEVDAVMAHYRFRAGNSIRGMVSDFDFFTPNQVYRKFVVLADEPEKVPRHEDVGMEVLVLRPEQLEEVGIEEEFTDRIIITTDGKYHPLYSVVIKFAKRFAELGHVVEVRETYVKTRVFTPIGEFTLE